MISVFILSFLLSVSCFAQETLRNAIDNGDYPLAKQIVRSGEMEEIYCGNMPPDSALAVYGKIFQKVAEASFAACPSQFSFSYGNTICKNKKEMETCNNVLHYLKTESVNENSNALSHYETVIQNALKTKAYKKTTTEKKDSLVSVPCTKKNFETCKAACIAHADSLKDSLKQALCDSLPEMLVQKKVTVKKPSLLYENLQTDLLDGFYKAPVKLSPIFLNLIEKHAKTLNIPDSLIPNQNYFLHLAEKHKQDSSAIPGAVLFRFCENFGTYVDSVLDSLAFDLHCPVFEYLTDSRDSAVYKVKQIGNTKWIVENLKYKSENSICYDDEEENCKTFGRLYTFDEANTNCPEGFHLANETDWKELENLAGNETPATKISANGSDEFAFSALFAGYANKNKISITIGEGAYFWVQETENDRGVARSFFKGEPGINRISVDKQFLLAARCVQNQAETSNTP